MGVGLCDGEGERAYNVYGPILGVKKYLKYFKRFAGAKKPSKNETIRSQNFRSRFDLAFRSHKNSIQKYHTNADQVENEGEVGLALMSLAEHDAPLSVFGAEAQDSAVLDSACTKTVCGRKWIESFIDNATKEAYSSILFLPSKRPFRFEDAPIVRSIIKVMLPIKIGERKFFIESEVVDKQIPQFLGKESLKRTKTQMHLTSDNITMFGFQVASFRTTSCYYAIPLTLSSCLPSETVLITAVDSLSMQSDEELPKSLLNIHKQFGQASFDRLLDLLRRCSQNVSLRLKLCLKTVVKSCDVCSQRTQPSLRSVVSLPFTSKFFEIVSMDLHQRGEKLWYFHITDLAPIIEADSIEQYGRGENVRIFGVQEEPGEDVHAKVVSVAEKAGVQITAIDVSTCHRLPGGGSGPKPLIANFVRRDTKHRLMKHKRNLKNTNIFVNDDLTPIRAKVTRELRKRDDDVASVHTVNEKNFVFMQDNEKLVFENLYKLQKWEKELLASICKSVKNFI